METNFHLDPPCQDSIGGDGGVVQCPTGRRRCPWLNVLNQGVAEHYIEEGLAARVMRPYTNTLQQ